MFVNVLTKIEVQGGVFVAVWGSYEGARRRRGLGKLWLSSLVNTGPPFSILKAYSLTWDTTNLQLLAHSLFINSLENKLISKIYKRNKPGTSFKELLIKWVCRLCLKNVIHTVNENKFNNLTVVFRGKKISLLFLVEQKPFLDFCSCSRVCLSNTHWRRLLQRSRPKLLQCAMLEGNVLSGGGWFKSLFGWRIIDLLVGGSYLMFLLREESFYF